MNQIAKAANIGALPVTPVHHADRGNQYLSIKYTERLADAGLEPPVGSVGDSYDNALAETINGLYKATFYRWYDLYRRFGEVALEDQRGGSGRAWTIVLVTSRASWPTI